MYEVLTKLRFKRIIEKSCANLSEEAVLIFFRYIKLTISRDPSTFHRAILWLLSIMSMRKRIFLKPDLKEELKHLQNVKFICYFFIMMILYVL